MNKKTKTTQTNKPIYSGQIEGAASGITSAYNAAQPAINQFSGNASSASNDLFAKYRDGDPTIKAAQGYIQDTLAGDPENNPYLDKMVGITNDNVRNTLQARMGTRGNTGGSDYYGMIGKALADNETGLRYSDYNNTMARRAQAAGMAPGVSAAQYQPLEAAMSSGQAGAMLPLQASLANAAGVGGLLGQYQNVKGTQKTSPGFMDILGMGLQGASLFSDRRLKTDIKRVGITDGGNTVYTYRYGGTGPYHMGVMADEVPEARGPDINGFATVQYERVT